jgi:hypothetical protein
MWFKQASTIEANHLMPSEKAKENKTLTSSCAVCGKAFSTELLRGHVIGTGRHRSIVAVCDACIDKPVKQESESPAAAEVADSTPDP